MLEGLSAFLLIAVPGLFQAFGSPEPVALTGCVVREVQEEVQETGPARFILSNAKKNPQDPEESGASYLLIPQAGLTLEGYVTRSVRITGTLARKSDSAATKLDDLPGLKAERLKLDGETCPDEDGGEEGGASESSGGSIGFSDLGAAGMPGFAFGGQSPHFILTATTSNRPLLDGLFGNIGGVGRTSQLNSGSIDSGSIDTSGVTSSVGTSTSAAPISSGASSTWTPSVASGFGSQVGPSIGTLPALTTIDTTSVGPAIAVATAAAALGLNVIDLNGVSVDPNAPAPIVNPEPASLIMLGTGLALAAYVGRRRFGALRG